MRDVVEQFPLSPYQLDVHAFAARWGATLLTTYPVAGRPLAWRCSAGHVFEVAYAAARDEGAWCGECSRADSVGEARSRRILEVALGVPFTKVRPEFLRRENGRCLELDGFSPALGLAFEFQGRQHYAHVPHFHRGGPTDLDQQQSRDREKVAGCRAAGVDLLVIPYTALPRLGDYIRARLAELGYQPAM